MRQIRVNLAKLQPVEPKLHAKVIEHIKQRGADPTKVGDMIVDLDKDYEDDALRDLQAFAAAETEINRIRQQRIDADQRLEQRKKDDEQAAYTYWQQQVSAGKILDSQKNRDAIISYLTERNLHPSVGAVQAALMALHETLEKPEVLGTLPNGEKQLPIDASESEMKRASVHQLRDLSARRFEGKSRPTGSFGGRF